MIITSEYVYNNIKLDETRNIVENNLEEYERKYGFKYNRDIKVECNDEFLDKIRNETINITIDRYNIIGELNKIMQTSYGISRLVKVIQVKLSINGKICNNEMDIYFKSGCMPILWRKFYVKILNNIRLQNCCEKHYCHFNERKQYVFCIMNGIKIL